MTSDGSGRLWVSASLRGGRQRLCSSHAHDGAGRAFCRLIFPAGQFPDVRNDFSWAADGHVRRYVERKERLSAADKAKDKAQVAEGKVKKGAGKALDDPYMEGEGKADQVKGNLKQAGEKVKDAFKK